jgi:hypothetical protein
MQHTARAVFAGVAGALVMSIVSLAFAQWGAAVNLEKLLGALLGFAPDSQSGFGAGFVLHMMLGGWFAVLYAEGFGRVSAGGWSMGAAFSIVHILVAGFLIAPMALFVSPAPSGAEYPAMFMAHQGLAGVCTFMLLHLTYGAVVGWVFEALGTPAPLESRRRLGPGQLR